MTKRPVTDEELVALADGELAPDAAERLHALVVADPDLAERFAILAETRFLLEGEKGEAQAAPDALPAAMAPADRSSPPRLAVVSGGRPAAPEEKKAARRRPRLVLPLAASLLFAAGGLAGYLAGGGGRSADGIAVAGFSRGGISAALSQTASGGEARLPDGKLRVIASYKLGDGRLCREYELTRAAGPGWDALDCRDGGNWRTEFLAAKAPPTTGYAPASGDSSIGAFLGERGAEPVPPGEESKVLGTGK